MAPRELVDIQFPRIQRMGVDISTSLKLGTSGASTYVKSSVVGFMAPRDRAGRLDMAPLEMQVFGILPTRSALVP